MLSDRTRRKFLGASALGGLALNVVPGLAGAEPTDAVDFEDLEPAAREVFRELLDEGELTGVTDVDPREVRSLVRNDHVRYRGRRYGVTATRRRAPRTILKGVSAGSGTDASTSIRYADLGERERAAFDAVSSGAESEVDVHPRDAPVLNDAETVSTVDGNFDLVVAKGRSVALDFRLAGPEGGD